MIKVTKVLTLFLICTAFVSQTAASAQTIQPLYGVLTQPLNLPFKEIAQSRPSSLSMSYIMKVYYQMLSSSGAMTLAIPYDLPIRKLTEVLPFLNGILVPDGYKSMEKDKSKEYTAKLGFILNWAKNRNNEGNFFSIVAIGKGFTELMKVSEISKDEDQLLDCTHQNENAHGTIMVDWVGFKSTNILKKLKESEIEYAFEASKSVPFAYNCSIPLSKFMLSSLPSQYNLVGTSIDEKTKLNFISLVEHKKYPFIGMQFNPEVSAYMIAGGHAKDKRTLRFYRELIVSFLLDHPSSLTHKIEDLPLTIRNMLMYKDIPVFGLRNQDQIYLYRRWAAGRDIDMPK